MKLASLEAYGAHPDLLAAWSNHYYAELLPIQEKAVLEGKVLHGHSVVGSGPTGCGKTFIAEMAATHAASQGRRAFYLCPTRALAEAVYAHLLELYGPLGLRIELSTQERRGADHRLTRGEFDIAVTVPEKLWAMALAGPAMVEGVGALVVDELQMVADPDRGPCLELLLARFLQDGHAQIVGLSAVLSNGQELADWLGAKLVEETRRPVELRKGVFNGGVFRYREHNTRQEGTEPIAVEAPEDCSQADVMVHLAVELARRGEPTLVFLRDRMSCVRAARLAAETAGADAPGDGQRRAELVERLQELPRIQTAHTLAELARHGVGFHNADLHCSERQLLERAFADGALGCLFATGTLAVGLNLPARNVIVEPMRWQSAGGAASLLPIGQSEFENMAGRAGRPGFGEAFGRAILVGGGGFHQDGLLRRYVEADPEPVKGQLHRLTPVQRLLLTTAISEQGGELRLLSPTSDPIPDTALPPTGATGSLLLTVSGVDGGMQLTGAGRLAATCGLSVRTIGDMATAVRTLGRPPTNVEALIVASLTAEVRSVPLPHGGDERHWPTLLEARARGREGWSEDAHRLLWGGPTPASQRAQSARAALMALEWMEAEDTAELERLTRLHAGRALALCEAIGWSVRCLARLVAETDHSPDDVERLEAFGDALSSALPEDCLELRRLHLATLQRDHYLGLVGAGLKTPLEVLNAPDEELAGLLPQGALAEVRRVRRAWQAARRAGAAGLMTATEAGWEVDQAGQLSSDPEAHGPRPVLVVDSGRPDCALINGHSVPLRPMEFQLLARLARTPQRCVTYEEIYDELWGSRVAVEPQQIYYHRHNVNRKLLAQLPPGSPDLVRTVSRRGLMLDLACEQVEAA
jgi:helicase